MKVFKNLMLNGELTDIVSDGGVISAIGKTGYTVRGVTCAPYEKRSLFGKK